MNIMKPKDKNYILEYYKTLSVEELSKELGLKERAIIKFLLRHKEKSLSSQKNARVNKRQKTIQGDEWKALSVVLAVGFILRLAGISWGLPLFNPLEGFYHPDEIKTIIGAAGFPQHVVQNTVFQYPTFYHYVIGILSLPIRLFFGQQTEQYFLYTYLLGRICSILLGTAAILGTYYLAKKIYDSKRALLASIFICLSMYHCQNSSWATVEALTSVLSIWFFLAAKKATDETGTIRDYIIAGILFGIAFGTKYTCAILIIPFIVMYLYAMIQKWPSSAKGKYVLTKVFNPQLFVFGIVTIVTFLITTPGIVIHFSDFIYWMNMNKSTGYQSFVSRASSLAWVRFFKSLFASMGAPLAVLFVFGLVFPFKKKKAEEVAMLVLLLVYFGYFAGMLLPRWVIIVMPFTAILASHGILSLYEQKQKMIRGLAGLLIVCTIAYSAFYCLGSVYIRLNDSRTQSARYVEKNVPLGTTVGIGAVSEIYPWRFHRAKYPNIDFSKYKELNFLEKPEILIVSSNDFKRMEDALKSDKLKEGYRWDEAYTKDWYRFSPPSPAVFKFYDELINGKEYVLLKAFPPKDFIRVGFPSGGARVYKKIN